MRCGCSVDPRSVSRSDASGIRARDLDALGLGARTAQIGALSVSSVLSRALKGRPAASDRVRCATRYGARDEAYGGTRGVDALTRVSVPVPENVKKQVDNCPTELGLDPSSSEAQRYALLVDEGARAMRARVRNERRRLAYAEHNESEGYVEALSVSEDFAFREGGF